MTSAGNLPSKFVFYIDVDDLESNNRWETGVKKCLQEAESRVLNSIAFPALGTGVYIYN